ncbi:MAG: ABC transporter permease [Planctomycetes bacterium]|nr:ABC transporter permease [Planctomycetota bacterium]
MPDVSLVKYILWTFVAAFYVWFLIAMFRDRRRVATLARHTFVESLRQRILLVPLLFMVVLICTSLFSAVFREVGRVRIVTQSCLWSLTVFGMVVAILLGTRGIPEDVGEKTIYSVMTKPVRRSSYLAGKIFGFSFVCLLVLLIMGTFSLVLIRWVGRNTALEARRSIPNGTLSVYGAGVEKRDGATWIVHEPGSTAKWVFAGLPELAREERAVIRMKFKCKPADASKPMAVAVELRNADGRSIYYDIADARNEKEAVTDVPGRFMVKGQLEVIVAPLDGRDYIEEDPGAIVVTAAKKEYHAESTERRTNSWATWRFTNIPLVDSKEKIAVRVRLHVKPGAGRKAIAGCVRVCGRDGVGPRHDVSIEDGKPLDIPIEDPFASARAKQDISGVLDVSVLPEEIGDAYEMSKDAVRLVIRGEEVKAERVLPEGYGLRATGEMYWISRALQRTAVWQFDDLPLRSLPEHQVVAEGHFKIGRAREIDLHVRMENPSAPEVSVEEEIHAVRANRYLVPADPVEVTFDRKMIDSRGRVDIQIRRKQSHSMVGLPFRDCFSLYEKPGSYDANFFTAVTVIFCQLVLIVAISVACSTTLSWPVSALFSFFVLFCGYIIDIMRNAARIMGPSLGHHGHGSVEAVPWVERAFNTMIQVVLGFLSYVLPDFRKFEVSQDVIDNRAISGISIVGAIGYSATYAAIAFVIGYILFRRREIE